MQQTFGHPSAGPGCLVESKRQEMRSKRLFVARLHRGSVCVGSDLSDRDKYLYFDEARKWIHARNGETEETTGVVRSPLLVYINLLALLYALHA